MATSALRRCGESLVAVFAGAAVGYLPFLLLTIRADGHGRTSFALVLGAFSIAGWLLVGLPVALSGLRPASVMRRALTVVASGCAGILLVALVFQGMNLLIAFLAFLPAAASMHFYLVLGTRRST